MSRAQWVKERRKAAVAAVTAAGVIASSDLLHGSAEKWLNTGVALAGLYGVHVVRNAPKRRQAPRKVPAKRV